MSQLPFEQQYLGETRLRRPLIAFVLSLVSPAAGLAYVGRLSAGVATSASLAILWFAFVIVWTKQRFFPSLPFATFALGWTFIAVMIGLDAAREAARVGDDYVLRDSNHPLAYAVLFTCATLLPLAAITHLAIPQLWSVVRVEDATMYPALVPGDELLVRNASASSRPPERGEIVLYQLEDETLRFGRVVGQPNDQVAMAEHLVFTNDQPALRFRATPDQRDELLAVSGETNADSAFEFETLGLRSYPITSPHQTFVAEPDQWTLGDNEFVVLNDDRSDRDDSRQLGVVRREQILGRPLFVAHSQETPSSALALFGRLAVPGTNAEGFRAQRVGKRVQPPVQLGAR